ncbi:hypothetical protein IAT38_004592 [Cryptococcus sp. DSM 104549]
MCTRSGTQCEAGSKDAPASPPSAPAPAGHSHGNDTPTDSPPSSASTAVTTASPNGQVESVDKKAAAGDQDMKHRVILDGLLRRSYHAGYADALASGQALASVQAEDAAIAAVLAPLEGAKPATEVAASTTTTDSPANPSGSEIQHGLVIPRSLVFFSVALGLTGLIGAVTLYAGRRPGRSAAKNVVMKELEAAGKIPAQGPYPPGMAWQVRELARLPSVPAWMTAPPVPKTWAQASRRMREHENDPLMQKLSWADHALIQAIVLQGGLARIPWDRRLFNDLQNRGLIDRLDPQSPLRAAILRAYSPEEPPEDEDPADPEASLENWRLREQLREAQEALEVLKKVGVERGVERTHAPGSTPVDGKAVAESIRQAVDKVEGAERVGASVDAYAESAPSASDAASAATPALPAKSAKQSLRAALDSERLAEDARLLKSKGGAAEAGKTSQESNDVAHATVDPTPEAGSSPSPSRTTGPEGMPDGRSRIRPFIRAPPPTPSYIKAPLTPQVPLGEEVMSMDALRKAVENIKASHMADHDGGASAATPGSETTPAPPSPLKTGNGSLGVGEMPTRSDETPLRATPFDPSSLRKPVEHLRKGYLVDESNKKAAKSKRGKTAKIEEVPTLAQETTEPSGGPKPAAVASTAATATPETPHSDKPDTIEVRLAKSSRYYFYLRPSFFTSPTSIPPARGSIAYQHASPPVYGPEVVEQVTVIKRCAPEDVARGVWEDLQMARVKVPGRQATGRVASVDDVSVWELELPIRPTSDGCRALVKIDGQWWESRVVKKLKGLGNSTDAVWLWTMGN